MKKLTLILASALLALASGCGDSDNEDKNKENENQDVIASGVATVVTSSITQQYDGNIESVRTIEGRDLPSAVVVASKAKTVYYVENDGSKLKEFASQFHGTGSSDDEYTNSASYSKDYTLITETHIIRDENEKDDKGNNKIVDCKGDFRIVGADGKSQATAVGPMPDSVAISPDKKYAITANEHDSKATWGKCPDDKGIPGISIISLENKDGLSAGAMKTIEIKSDLKREPEYIAVSSDNDTVAVTLQDSHEVAIFSIKDVMAKEGDVIDESVLKIVKLPNNPADTEPWPDGVIGFDADGKHYFAIAGEANDTIIIIDDKGAVVSNTFITEKEVPTNYPCLNASDFPGVKYSPDSITSFKLGSKVYVASTLRYAGAVIFYDVTNPAKPVFEMITRAGQNDVIGTGTCTEYDGASKVYPEGITSNVVGNAAYVWVANEGDSTVTSMKIEAKK